MARAVNRSLLCSLDAQSIRVTLLRNPLDQFFARKFPIAITQTIPHCHHAGQARSLGAAGRGGPRRLDTEQQGGLGHAAGHEQEGGAGATAAMHGGEAEARCGGFLC